VARAGVGPVCSGGMFTTDDTIVAISSAAGAAGRSIVRLSGPDALRLAGEVFSEPLGELGGFRLAGGTVGVDEPHPIRAPARAYVFSAPRSYTRQDMAELHVPGEVIAAAVHAAMVAGGARPAEAGEFTARAFFNGRVDLAQAQAVADVIDAEADAQLRSAVGIMDGALGRLCRPAAEALTEALALAEASIDFSDEDVELARPGDVAAAARRVADDLAGALDKAGRWMPSSAEPRVAIAGRPNAGKSSLLNALSGLDRAIVSAMAGTTRDVLSAAAALAGGVEVMLLDAAGLDASPDPLSRATHTAAREAVAAAEAVLFVIDAADGDHDADEALLGEVRRLNRRAPLLALAGKIDLLADADEPLARLRRRFGDEMLPVSSVTGAGLDELRAALAAQLADASPPLGGEMLLHDRQRRAISLSADCARRAGDLLARAGAVADVAEIAAVELRAALDHLAELTGRVVAEDVLAAIFARFCGRK
jgi:tRNA modification GTPase